MPPGFHVSTRALRRTTMLCAWAGITLFACSAQAETLMYPAQKRTHTDIQNAADNAYQQRRLQERVERKRFAGNPPLPTPVEVTAGRETRKPFKVTIPNIAIQKSQPQATALAMEKSPAALAQKTPVEHFSEEDAPAVALPAPVADASPAPAPPQQSAQEKPNIFKQLYAAIMPSSTTPALKGLADAAPADAAKEPAAETSAPKPPPAALPAPIKIADKPTPEKAYADMASGSLNLVPLPETAEAPPVTLPETLSLVAVPDMAENAPGAQAAPEAPQPGAETKKPHIIYSSPGIIIKKESEHIPGNTTEMATNSILSSPQELAALTPSAGGDEANTPLIPLPEATPSDAPPSLEKLKPLVAPPSAPAAAAPAQPAIAIPDAPLSPGPLSASAPDPLSPPPPVPPVQRVPAPAAAPETPLAPPASAPVTAEAPAQPLPAPDALLDSLIDTPEAASTSLPAQPPSLGATSPSETATQPPEQEKPANKEKGAARSAGADAKKKEKSPSLMTAAGSVSEPRETLSRQSKEVAKKLPATLDKKAKSAPPFSIDHAKNAKDIFKPANPAAETIKHEALGIKIEVKKPKFDQNYELEKAYNALSSGQSGTAIDLYRNVLANDPDNTNALFGLATLYHRAGQIEMARPLYAKLLAIDPNNRDGWNNFLVLLADEAPEDALPQLQKLQARNPAFSPIPAQMSVIYQKMGDLDKASEQMFKAIKLAPENLTYRYNLAILLDKEKKYDEAADLYAQILEAYRRGESIPGNAQKIQQRLTFISSNRP